jgi:catechol 2,3-dioxygenase-like lactoylglutathione lyase family enzyme
VEVAPGTTRRRRSRSPHRPPTASRRATRETGIGLHVNDIDAYHAQLKADGVNVDAEVSRMRDPVPTLLWLRDPEGNTLMVIGRFAASAVGLCVVVRSRCVNK